MNNIKKIFGPPGAGKTTYLLNVVNDELEKGVPSVKMGYFSFTRKAANEARDRAIQKFPHLNAKTDFPYFRTLHSLAFHCLSLKKEDVMSAEHFREFAKEAGLDLKVSHDTDMDMLRPDNPVLNEINIARIKGLDLRKHYNQSALDIEWHHFEYVERSYRHYKSARNLLDFTDMLERIVQEPHHLPELDVLIIDEAQDLSRLQWKMVEELCLRSKRVWVAGDDDQAIFTWAGADVNSFLSFSGEIQILEQSYRVPAAVHKLANDIIQRIKNRQAKIWKPREVEGYVRSYMRFEDVPIDKGQWLIMATTNYMLNPIHEWLKSNGILFERGGVMSISQNILEAVHDWERLRKGQAIGYENVKAVYRLLGTDAVLRGHKTFKTGDPEKVYTMDELKAHYGLQTDEVWYTALEKIPDDKKTYLVAILRRGTKFSEAGRIRLSTIHAAKGGEADNVLLLMDLSPKFANEASKNSDNVNRLFYVGITRAKQSLHLVLPQRIEKGFQV